MMNKEKRKMRIVDAYILICKKFAEETKDWHNIDQCKHYTTTYPHDWEETSDNAHGGFDVSWAFHQTEKYIEENAHIELAILLREIFELVLDDGWDKDGVGDLFDCLVDLGDMYIA